MNSQGNYVSGKVISVIEGAKIRSNGKPFQTVMVEFMDSNSPLNGMSYWATRTLVSKDGDELRKLEQGDEVHV
jgi:hypothetical protein